MIEIPRMKRTYILLFAVLLLTACNFEKESTDDYVLWYEAPARQWKEALPIGNGRLGTMVAGNIHSDTLVINEETVWSGGIHDYINPEAINYLDDVQSLLRQHREDEALEMADAHMIGIPRQQQYYQPLGKLIIETGHPGEVSHYKRSLNLNKALVKVAYEHEGNVYRREIFASHPDELLVLRYTTDASDGLELKIRHTSDLRSSGSLDRNIYRIYGKGDDGRGIDGAIRFTSCLEVVKGDVSPLEDGAGLKIRGGKEIILHYTAATSYRSYNDLSADPDTICEKILFDSRQKSYQALLKRHTEDHAALFSRMDISLGSDPVPEEPTNVLLEKYSEGQSIPYLESLFFQMSRYLTIASSRPGTQPMNLQGIWNANKYPVWGCKWTLNINVEMNYWLSEVANLADCHEPLFDMIGDLHQTGSRMAREHYGARGFMAHHNTDLWRGTAPVDGANWGLWPLGGAWLTRHLWEHFLYSGDMNFLEMAYPVMKDASLFFFDHLIEGPEGYLVTSPAISFEQSYRLPDGSEKRLCEGPTMDNQILRDLFNNCLRAAKTLRDEQSYMDSLMLIRDRLRPTEIDAENGELMEWPFRAQPSVVGGQLAPLWGVNPGYEIHPLETPDLARAAIATMDYREPRIAENEILGSWVSGTRANFRARLWQAEESYTILRRTMAESMFPNFLVYFLSPKYFQIDGNLGTASAMCEMILQSQRSNEKGEHIIDLLPALPAAWQNGSVRGIRARGGFELDMKWEEGVLKSVKILSKSGNSCHLVYKEQIKIIETESGESYTWKVDV